MNTAARKESIAEKIRFLLVGGFNTVVGIGSFSAIQFLTDGALHEVVVLLLSHAISSSVAFVLHRWVVFRVSGPILMDWVRFQSVYVLPLSINAIVLPLLVRVAGVNVYLAQVMFTCVAVVISYLGHKHFSFRRSPDA
ncbi:MAG: conserved rane protein [Actinomycetota bacterium]|jgi:putative flippase GtrA